MSEMSVAENLPGWPAQHELLLEDYRTTITLMQHEDNRKAHLLTTYFLIQSVLGAFFGWAIEKNVLVAAGVAAAGTLLSLFWYFVMERMKLFIEMRYQQLKWLEEQLNILIGIAPAGGLQNITEERKLRAQTKKHRMRPNTVELRFGAYEIKRRQNIFSISLFLESALPMAIGAMWVVAALLGVALQ